MRFNEILNKLKELSPRTLSIRLKELEKVNFIKREAFAEIPPRVEYSLTEDGKEMKTSLQPLMEWAYKKSLSLMSNEEQEKFNSLKSNFSFISND